MEKVPLPADACARISGMVGAMAWSQLLAVCVICWLAVAVVVGTIVGHGIAFGASGDPG
jgi:hypothetical protein